MGGRGSTSGMSSTGGGSGRQNDSSSENANIKRAVLGLPKDEQKDFYFHSSDISEKYYNQYSEKSIEESAKYNSFTVNESLPELTGSEKQVSWAENIRTKLLSKEVESIDSRSPSSVEGKKQLIEQAKASGMKVNSYSDVLNQALKQSKTFKWLKETTSAKELIDNRNGKIF